MLVALGMFVVSLYAVSAAGLLLVAIFGVRAYDAADREDAEVALLDEWWELAARIPPHELEWLR